MKGRFSEEQIIGLLKQHEASPIVVQFYRDHNVIQGAFYKWEAKFAGINV